MAEEVTSTVKTSSDGTVKLTLETYQDLLARAAEKAPIVYNTIHKTPKMVAEENTNWGIFLMAGGAAMSLVGTIPFFIGRKQKKALKR